MKEAIEAALKVLKEGGVILYPTDTVWGLGCDATNAAAVTRIMNIKKRDESKSLVCLVSNDGMLQRFVRQVPDMAWQLIDISDKPLTIVYPGAIGLAANAIADDGSMAIRVVKHEFCQQLIHRLNRPLISTSANISGEHTPASLAEISEAVRSAVDYTVPKEFQGSASGQASSILKLELSGEIKIIRK
ncbi:MAG: L-threonylcarbamoyladenylate synthase [Bacteroidota bacterium]